MTLARIAIITICLALFVGTVSTLGAEGDDEWAVNGRWVAVANADDVRALARDGADLWAGTASGGVARWSPDGTMRQYLAPQNGLPCNDVRDIVEWRGTWWFATCEGLAVYNPSRDRMEMVSAPLPSASVTGLAVADDGRLWVTTEQWWDPESMPEGKDRPGGWVGGGVAHTADASSWFTVSVDDGLSSANARDAISWRGSIWVATEPYQRWVPPTRSADGDEPGRWEQLGGGVAQFDGSRWSTHDSNGNTELSDSARMLAATDSALWVGTRGRGLVAFDGGRWASLQDCGDELRCIQDDYVTALAVSGDGAVWVGTSRFNGRGTGVGVLDDRGTPTDGSDDAWHVIRGSD
jgi:ligand-binding sensor domain-containing protein